MAKEVRATGAPKCTSIEAIVIRADGPVEDLGVISYWHRNPLRRLWFWLKQNFRELSEWR